MTACLRSFLFASVTDGIHLSLFGQVLRLECAPLPPGGAAELQTVVPALCSHLYPSPRVPDSVGLGMRLENLNAITLARAADVASPRESNSEKF